MRDGDDVETTAAGEERAGVTRQREHRHDATIAGAGHCLRAEQPAAVVVVIDESLDDAEVSGG